tara:strand:+ start:4694 stop:5323 length:630 start_codon:yes stop_codon:yes gene_type:complete
MKSLFIGGSSQLAEDLAKRLKDVDSISKSKCKNYSKVFKIKNYKVFNIKKIFKNIKKKYDNVVIFNGQYQNSTLSNFSKIEFKESFYINFEIPLLFATEIINNKFLNKNGSIFFLSSIAADSSSTGNAYYSLSKNALNYAAKILSDEQKKRGVRVNVISVGIMNNRMGKSTLVNFSHKKFKFVKKESYINKMIKVLKNKKINKKKIFIK